MPAKTEDNSTVYRFNDLVAVSFTSTHQLYLTPEHAAQLGQRLVECAQDIGAISFQKSMFQMASFKSEE